MQAPIAGAPKPTWRDICHDRLAPLLGGFTAEVALKTVTLRVLKRPPEQVRVEELPPVFEALRPILITLAGAVHANVMLDQIRADLASGGFAGV